MKYIIKSSPEDYLGSHHYICDESGARTKVMILITGDINITYDKDMPITILRGIEQAYAMRNADIVEPASSALSFHDCIDIALNHSERSLLYKITDNNEGFITFKLFARLGDTWTAAVICMLDIIENTYEVTKTLGFSDLEDTAKDICSDILDDYGQNFDHLSIEPYIHKVMEKYYKGEYDAKNE